MAKRHSTKPPKANASAGSLDVAHAAEKDKASAQSKKGKKAAASTPEPLPKTTATSANAGAPAYLAIFNTSAKCKKDKRAIEKNCAPDKTSIEDQEAKTGGLGELSAAVKAIDKKGREKSNYSFKHDNAWMDKHCDGMWNKPVKFEETETELNNAAKTTLEALKGANNSLLKDCLQELGGLALEKGGAAAGKEVAGLLARSAAKINVGGVAAVGSLATAGEAAIPAEIVPEILSAARELATLAGPGGQAALESAMDAVNMGDKIEEVIAAYQSEPHKALAEAMTLQSKFNRCLQAKRCQLVPMNQTSPTKAAQSGNGCCPGQTGHHLLPKEMFKRKVQVPTGGKYKNGKPELKWVDDRDNCEEYTDDEHNSAPVVCVEGTNNRVGSHGTIHKNIEKLMATYREERGASKRDYISRNNAIDAAVKSHQQTFKPACDAACLKAQLNSFYKKFKCKKMKPRGGLGSDATIEAPANSGNGTVA